MNLFYLKMARTAYRLLKAKGGPLAFSRKTADEVDIAAGTVEEGTPMTTTGYGVVLPANPGNKEVAAAFDNKLADKSLAKKEKRYLKVAALGMSFTPESLDRVEFGGAVWEVVGCTVVAPDPDGTNPIVYGVGVFKLGPEPEPEPAP